MAKPVSVAKDSLKDRELYEISRSREGYTLYINGVPTHGPDYLAIILDKLETRILKQTGVI